MKRNVYCCSPSDLIEGAARQMRDRGIGFLPICDESRRVLGTLTDRDLVIRGIAEGLPNTAPCNKVMTRQVISCSPQDNLLRAEQLMSEHRIARMVCVDDQDRLVGVISLSDVAQLDTDRHVARTVREVTEREAPITRSAELPPS